ncbi:MAG: AMP-binding protein [Demequinaceae bacterium]|nr:AMP-binding protein [Demequinaceae bacterium]
MVPEKTAKSYPVNMPALVTEAWTEFRDAVVLQEKDGKGGWRDITGAEALEDVRAIAKGLISEGLKPGERVGIMARTRLEWTYLDFAILFANGIPVPIYDTSSADQVDWITSDSDIRLVFVETKENLGLVSEVAQGQSPITDIRCIDTGAVEDLIKVGKGLPDTDLDKRSKAAKPDDVSTIIYTSGTTGRPKGVMLSHFNMCRQAVGVREELHEVLEGGSTLQFMTLAHIFARLIQTACIYSGTVIGYCPDSREIGADMTTFHPTLLVAVPRVFEKVYNGAEQKAMAGGKVKIFRWAAKQAIDYSKALDAPEGPSRGLKFRYKVSDHLVLSKIRHATGGRLKWAVSGGAPLGERLAHFFRGLGLIVLEGYGLTETTAASHVNRPNKNRIGTVGIPLPGLEAKIAPDGEILLKGDIVFSGYYRNDAATKDAIRKGWFHTGDIGELDADGFLKITGRKKDLIVTAGGKNVAPAVLEDRLRSHPLISQCVAIGDARPFIGMLITLDEEALPGWLKAHDLEEMTVAEAAAHPAVKATLDKAIERTNQAVSRAESIRKYRILFTDFTVLNGYLTPSLKVKRARVIEDFASDIAALYIDDRTPIEEI